MKTTPVRGKVRGRDDDMEWETIPTAAQEQETTERSQENWKNLTVEMMQQEHIKKQRMISKGAQSQFGMKFFSGMM